MSLQGTVKYTRKHFTFLCFVCSCLSSYTYVAFLYMNCVGAALGCSRHPYLRNMNSNIFASRSNQHTINSSFKVTLAVNMSLNKTSKLQHMSTQIGKKKRHHMLELKPLLPIEYIGFPRFCLHILQSSLNLIL